MGAVVAITEFVLAFVLERLMLVVVRVGERIAACDGPAARWLGRLGALEVRRVVAAREALGCTTHVVIWRGVRLHSDIDWNTGAGAPLLAQVLEVAAWLGDSIPSLSFLFIARSPPEDEAPTPLVSGAHRFFSFGPVAGGWRLSDAGPPSTRGVLREDDCGATGTSAKREASDTGGCWAVLRGRGVGVDEVGAGGDVETIPLAGGGTVVVVVVVVVFWGIDNRGLALGPCLSVCGSAWADFDALERLGLGP